MFALNAKAWRILTPDDEEYYSNLRELGVTQHHIAVSRDNPKNVRILPLLYAVFGETANGGEGKRHVKVDISKTSV